MTDPAHTTWRRGATRLIVAAAIAAGLLGLSWLPGDYGTGDLTPGMVLTSLTTDLNGDLVLTSDYVPGIYSVGLPGSPIVGSQTDVRVLLVPAAAALALAAFRRTRTTRRGAQLAIGALLIAALLGISSGAAIPAGLCVTAAGLAASVLWPDLATRVRPRAERRTAAQAT